MEELIKSLRENADLDAAECVAEHEECTKLPYDEKYLHHPDTGTGWKCYVCGYGGTANNYANTFCVNCHCHR